MLAAGLLMGIVILPVAEVASQFREAGGMYLYARTAFGRFIGLQVGWFWLLAIVGGGAAGANLFLLYLAHFLPSVAHGWSRFVTLLLVIAVPTAANYLGVRQGVNLSVLFTAAKILPLSLVIGIGLLEGGSPSRAPAQLLPSSLAGWPKLLLILVYAFSGWEDALVPTGEIQQPRRAIPFGLTTGLFLCAVVYTLFQFVIVRTIGASPTDRPVIETASALLGPAAGSFVAIAVMLSTYGWISGAFLNAPRFPMALAQQGDCAALFGRLHPRFNTPSVGILLYGAVVLMLALTGSFLWAIALTAGSLTVFYSVTCAALIQLRRTQPAATAFRLPLGRLLAVVGIGTSLVLLAQLELRQLGLMSITALFGAANWLWARRNGVPRSTRG
jgi:APA family basic amino acid/polyamine antiporter